jgi:ribosome-binding protein aMBF1 (putative translation factor)
MTITGEQVRAARELLGWPRKTLAGKCKPGETTIRNFENGVQNPRDRERSFHGIMSTQSTRS